MIGRLAIGMSFLASGIFGYPTRSNIGANHIYYGLNEEQHTYTASDYVQDGLVAMYDGIENVGYGQHSDSTASWVNIVGTGWNGSIGSSVVIERNSVLLDGIRGVQSAVTIGKGWFGQHSNITVECMIQPLGWNYRGEYGPIAAFGGTESGTGGFTLWTNAGNGYNGSRIQVRDSVGRKFLQCSYKMDNDLGDLWHIAMTIDGKNAIVYENGISYSKTSMGEVVYTGAENYDFFIGGDYWGPIEYNFNGRIFFLRIYGRALTAEEIAYNHSIDVERFGL